MRDVHCAPLHAAPGKGILAQIPHAAVTQQERLVVLDIVHGNLVSVSQPCSKLVQGRVNRAQIDAQLVAHLWIIVSSVSWQPKVGRRNTPGSDGVHGRDQDHRAASETGSSISNATYLNRVQSTAMEGTKLEGSVENGRFASGSARRGSSIADSD